MAGAGCLSAAQVKDDPPLPAPYQGQAVPKGTLASAQLVQPLSTAKSHPGDRFTLELLDPLTDGEGRQVVGRGAIVEGVVHEVNASRAAGEGARLDLSVLGVQSPGEGVVPIPAEVASAPFTQGSGLLRGLSSGLLGAAAGAGTGLALDHQQASVVVGAAVVGAGVGVLLSYLFGSRETALPAGSVVTLRLTRDWRLAHPVATGESPPPCRVPTRSAQALAPTSPP